MTVSPMVGLVPPEDCQQVLGFLGANIRRRRKRLDMTQSEVAEEADLELRYFQRLERGMGAPSVRTLVDIANVLGCSAHDLLKPCRIQNRPTGRPRKKRRKRS